MALNIIFIMWTVALVANLCVTLKDIKNSKETAKEISCLRLKTKCS